jgi:23S rRNA (cytidine1920-2'-O)/16S rRNA (cytidine1409-2'-O)-methyltransferase
MSRRRIDTLLAERGLARSRTSAAESVRAGRVRVGRDGPVATRPAELVADDVELLVDAGPPFVSRGGTKLTNALDALAIDIQGLDCLDVGASTGGFTDCLLQRGANRVAALDVGYGQLDWTLRNDERVTVMERFNARELSADDLPFTPALAAIDVSFISLDRVLGPVAAALGEHGRVLALVKPQFELGRERVGRGGVVRAAADRRDALLKAAAAAEDAGLAVLGFASSGLPGPKGNRETFMWASRRGEAIDVAAAALLAEPDETGGAQR